MLDISNAFFYESIHEEVFIKQPSRLVFAPPRHLYNYKMLVSGSEVDKLFKILIKTSNAAEYIESETQNIEAPRTDDPII